MLAVARRREGLAQAATPVFEMQKEQAILQRNQSH